MSSFAKKRWANTTAEERSEYARNMAIERHRKAGHTLKEGLSTPEENTS